MVRLLTALVLGLCLAACSSSPSSSTAPSTTPSTGVGISPSEATTEIRGVVQFIVLGAGGQNFTWSVAGTGCSGASCGTIDATGRYTAPPTVPDPATVTVTARSIVDSRKSFEATVTISPPESFSMSLNSIEFGNQMINTTSAPRVVTLTNTGSTPQPVYGRINGPPGHWQNYAYTTNCPSTIAVGASCTFNITFTPSAAGDRAALLIVDGTFEQEGTVNLGGTGTN